VVEVSSITTLLSRLRQASFRNWVSKGVGKIAIPAIPLNHSREWMESDGVLPSKVAGRTWSSVQPAAGLTVLYECG